MYSKLLNLHKDGKSGMKLIVSSVFFMLLLLTMVFGFTVLLQRPLEYTLTGDTFIIMNVTIGPGGGPVNITNVTFFYDNTLACYNDSVNLTEYTCLWNTTGITGNFTINATAFNTTAGTGTNTNESNISVAVAVDTSPAGVILVAPEDFFREAKDLLWILSSFFQKEVL